MSNLHTGNQARLEDYPPGIQCLLKDAKWHVEQLGLLEREFRAWQAAQGEPEATGVYIVNALGQKVELFALPGRPAPWTPATAAPPD